MSNIIWIIVVGFVAGIIARLLSPGANNPQGFILTTILGIAGAFVATFLGQMLGWYRLDNIALRALFNSVFEAGVAYEGLTQRTADFREGVTSFLEKRPPDYSKR